MQTHAWTGLVEEPLTHSVIGAFFEVYNALGFGFLENVYVLALEQELVRRGHSVRREVRVQIYYKGAVLTSQRLDFVVDDRLVIEIKATELLPKTAARQLLNYLRASKYEVGLLLHFGPRAKFYRLVAANVGR